MHEDIKKLVNLVLQRNAFFGNAENLLLTMLGDDRKYIREEVRQFNIPNFYFKAGDYFKLNNRQSSTIMKPPLSVKISDKELQEIITILMKSKFQNFYVVLKPWNAVLN